MATLIAVSYLVSRYSYIGSLYDIWSSPGELHAPVLVLLAFYLLIRDHAEIGRHGPAALATALGLMSVVSLMWFASDVTNLLVGQHVTTFLAAVAILVSQFGARGALTAFTPLGLVLLSMPLWSSLTSILQTIAAVSADWIVTALGVLAHRDGHLIEISNGVFRVDPGCSGLSYLTAAVALGLVQGHLARYSLIYRLTLIVGCSLLAIVGNAIRIASVVMIGAAYGMDQPLVKDHLVLGWVIFAVLTFPLIFLPNSSAAPTGKERGSVNAYVGPRGSVALGVALAIVLVASPLSKAMLERLPAAIQIPIATATLERVTHANGWQPGVVGADVRAAYRRNGDPDVFVFAYGYASQRQGKELVNQLAPPIAPPWRASHAHTADVAGVTLNSAVIDSRNVSGERYLVWYCYVVGGVPTTSALIAKSLEIVNAVNRKGAWIVAFRTRLIHHHDVKRAMEAAVYDTFRL